MGGTVRPTRIGSPGPRMAARASGFRVQGVSFRVQGQGFGAWV